jgi:ketosteroid isomerase-like protein
MYAARQDKEVEMNPVTAPIEVAPLLSPIDRTAIDTYLIRMEQLEKANNWRNLTELMAKDCITMPPRHSTTEGRRNWLRWIEDTEFRVSDFHLRPQEIEGCGNLAFVRCDYRWTYTLKGRTEPIEDSGRFLAILRKESDDRWLATHWIWNSDQLRH